MTFPKVPLIVAIFCTSLVTMLADTIPVAIKKYHPVYPKAELKAKIPGEVLLEFIVDSTGAPRRVHVIKATNKNFAEAAARCILRWRFKPGTKDGRPVNVAVTMPMGFAVADDSQSSGDHKSSAQ